MSSRKTQTQNYDHDFQNQHRKSSLKHLFHENRAQLKLLDYHSDPRNRHSQNLLIDSVLLFRPVLINRYSRNPRFVSQFHTKLALDQDFLRKVSTPKFTNFCFQHLEKMGGSDLSAVSAADVKWISAILFYFQQSLHVFELDFLEINHNVVKTIVHIFIEAANPHLKSLLLVNLCRFLEDFASKFAEADNGFVTEICRQIHDNLMFFIFDSRDTPPFVSLFFHSICRFYRIFLADLQVEIDSEEVT